MACNFPLKAMDLGINPENHKKKIKVIKWTEYISLPKPVQEKCIDLPCGRCIECRLAYSRMWADRLMIEGQSYPDDQKKMITLTYDSLYVPRVDWLDEETGECGTALTLVKKDVQDFIKRFRKNYSDECKRHGVEPNHIKYYLCGEYGSNGARPHYHIIIFGYPWTDLVLEGKSRSGFPSYSSEFVRKCWKFGLTSVNDMSWDVCAYVARYVCDKLTGEAAERTYKYYNILPEFNLMSKKPAIGREFFEKNYEKIYQFDEFYISTGQGGRAVRPCRYYDTLYDRISPIHAVRLRRLKDKRSKYMKMSLISKLRQTSLDLEEMRINADQVKRDTVNKKLPRRL